MIDEANSAVILDFEVKWLQKKAFDFVNLFVTEGRVAAAEYSLKNIPPEKRPFVKPFVQEEFNRRGITV